MRANLRKETRLPQAAEAGRESEGVRAERREPGMWAAVKISDNRYYTAPIRGFYRQSLKFYFCCIRALPLWK